jgi:hypothetical protein
MFMLLGDRIKKATAAVGIKPCAGCEKRAELLNQISRRGILKSVGLFAGTGFFQLKHSTLRFLWGFSQDGPPISIHHVMGLVRTLNTLAFALYAKYGVYPDLPTLLGEEGLLSMKGRFKPGMRSYEWASRLNFLSDEILPGWFIDYTPRSNSPHINPPTHTGQGCMLVVTGAKSVVVSDETAVIYCADKPVTAPKAKDLARAQDYPGAKPFTEYAEPITERFKWFFTPSKVYATVGNCRPAYPDCPRDNPNSSFCTTCCLGIELYGEGFSAGFSGCMVIPACCRTFYTTGFPSPYTFVTITQPPTQCGDCITNACNLCADEYFGTQCFACPANSSCPQCNNC